MTNFELFHIDENPESELDPEEIKLREEEDAQRKIKPENFKAMLLSKAGEGIDEPNKNNLNTRKNQLDDESVDQDLAKVLGEVTIKETAGKEDYYDYLRKVVKRNNEK